MRPDRRLRLIAIATLALVVSIAGLLGFLRGGAEVPDFATLKAGWQPSEAYLLDRHGELLHARRIDHGVRRFDWVPLESISPALIEAVVDGEDRRFWHHAGVDWRAVLAALRDNVRGDRRRGASTITMQVAALARERSGGESLGRGWSRKLAQMRLAQALEARWSKTQILEAYLNLLGFRGELEGIDAAARLLAGKAPSGLSLPEGLVLAALLPSPGARLDEVIGRACSRARARRLSIECASIDATSRQMLLRANAAPAQAEIAPHVARRLLKAAGERMVSTLDASVQRLAYDTLRRHLADLSGRNVRDGAVLVVDNESADVLAYVGSAGPYSSAHQVDGVRARRQAGSTLKPFLYGLALERRYLTAATLLDDSPIHLDTATGLYLPQNYDHEFRGLVSVRTALGSSLNVPAVRTLVLVGVEALRDRLHDLGYAGITEDGEYYGYSLALGSAEVSLWEQVQAYRSLALGGRWSPLRLAPGAPKHTPLRRLGEDASFVIADMLSDRSARISTFGLESHLNTRFWSAVKTGTSKDMRDNWCIGFSQRYTVGVWVGNFEGDSMYDVTGVTGAAPVWQEIMTALHDNAPPDAPLPPQGVVKADIRFVPAVEAPRREWFLAGTTMSTVTAVPHASASAHIASPANGLVIAVDPDIPRERQRVPFVARGASGPFVFRLNGELVGRADREVLWEPMAGTHRLVLEDAAGATVDRVLFSVR